MMQSNVVTHPIILDKERRGAALKSVYIEPGTLKDYEQLSRYHYRCPKTGPIAGIWVMRSRLTGPYIQDEPAAVIVYTYPAPNLAVRGIVTGKYFSHRNKSLGLRRLNSHVRCISRVIVAPPWRGLGLASRLVAITMPLLNVAMIESMAAMGRFHPFLEKAGMRRFAPPEDRAAASLIQTLESLRIGRDIWHDPDKVQVRMDCLCEMEADRLDRRIRAFLSRFGKRRKMLWSIERTTFVLEHLSAAWMYYAWLNPNIPIKGLNLQNKPGTVTGFAVAGHPESRFIGKGSLCDVNPIGILRPHTNGASFAQNDKPQSNYPVNPVNPVKNYNTKEQ